MATAADLRELEKLCPWEREDFRAGLGALTDSVARAAQQFAADMRLIAELAAQVPRCAFDETGATPWTSFRREVAVARRLSDRAAAAEIRDAGALTGPAPRTLALLELGLITVPRARAFLRELEVYDDELVRQLDARLAERAAGLPAWRIVQEVRRVVGTLDAEAAAARTATKNAERGVTLDPQADDQAVVSIFGPAVALTRWSETLDQRARALKQAGDPRTLAQLRFDLATSTFPCATHAPASTTAAEDDAAPAGSGGAPAAVVSATGSRPAPPAGAAAAPRERPDAEAASAGLRASFLEQAEGDCRTSRPVQASITVPVETSLGLSNEPAWLDGYGWISAPTARLLLVDAELRRVCVQTGTGQVVDIAARGVRPPPTPEEVRRALLDMVEGDVELSDGSWRVEQRHDPSPPLRRFVEERDRFCDGPTGSRVSARRSDLDHNVPYPHGPTAAWNLAARSRRTHQLKHFGWTPLRTPTSTLWFSPAGQLVEVPHDRPPSPGVDADPSGAAPTLPAADDLAALDEQQLQPRPDDEPARPWLPASEQLPPVTWTWLETDEPF